MRRYALVVAAALLAHLTALSGGFAWLDHAHIEGGLALAPRSNLLSVFTHGFAGTSYYRPLMSLSLSLDAFIGGPRVFHLVSLAMHACAAALLVVAAGALGLARRAALFAGLLFAVHPLTSLVADAIAFRSEAFVAIALFALIWAHTQYRPLVAAAAVAFGLLSKETALVLAPLFLVVLELGPRGTTTRPNFAEMFRTRRRLFAAEGGAFAFGVVLRWEYAPRWRASYERMDVGDAIGTRLASVAKSAAAILLPTDRSICDAFSVTHWWNPGAIAGLATLVGIAVLAWSRRGPALLLALALLPSLQLVPIQRWWSPHYLYLPLAFVAMLVGEAASRREGWTGLVLGAVIVVLGVASFADGTRYRDDVTLWTREVARQPMCREGHFFLGDVERDARRWAAAARHYEAALAPRPRVLAYVDRSAALQNLGAVRLEQGRFADAHRAYREALDGTRDARARRELTHNLAAAAMGEGNETDAIALLDEEVSRPDALPESLKLCAEAFRRLGRDEDAQRLLERLSPPHAAPRRR